MITDNRWIDVDILLPEKHQQVLVSRILPKDDGTVVTVPDDPLRGKRRVISAWFDGENFRCQCCMGWLKYKPTHWQPLPYPKVAKTGGEA